MNRPAHIIMIILALLFLTEKTGLTHIRERMEAAQQAEEAEKLGRKAEAEAAATIQRQAEQRQAAARQEYCRDVSSQTTEAKVEQMRVWNHARSIYGEITSLEHHQKSAAVALLISSTPDNVPSMKQVISRLADDPTPYRAHQFMEAMFTAFVADAYGSDASKVLSCMGP